MNQKAIYGLSFCSALIDALIKEEKPLSRRHRKLSRANEALLDALDHYPGAIDDEAMSQAVELFEVLEDKVCRT